MNRQELLEEINFLVKEKKLQESLVMADVFTQLPDYYYLGVEFDKNKIKNEKWHQLVRFALSDPKEGKYMYDRLLELLLIHRRSYNDYFELKTESATTPLPDRLSYLNRLSLVHREYFAIFKSIMGTFHFDYPLKKSLEVSVRGKVDWSAVSKKFPITFPVLFDTSLWKREFNTTENILLILSAIWLGRESNRLLTLSFTEPLNVNEVHMLNSILKNTQEIVRTFPFSEVISDAKKYANLSINDKRVLHIESQTKYRIENGQIKESNSYRSLLKWISKFRQLNIRMVSSSLTNFSLDTLDNLDTIYEAWIFFEIMDATAKRYGLISMNMRKKPYYFEFEYLGHLIKFVYEQQFDLGQKYAWAVSSKPDFTVMEAEKIIAIFDAKNYRPGSDDKNYATNKMLAYMTNLDANFGALFFPNFTYAEFIYPGENDSPKYHFNLKLVHYIMKPNDTEDAIKVKNEMKCKMLSEITDKINTIYYHVA
jgi:hypothetical protein